MVGGMLALQTTGDGADGCGQCAVLTGQEF